MVLLIQVVLFRTAKKCNIVHASVVRHLQVPLSKGEKTDTEEDVGKDYYKQKVHWRKLGVNSIVAFLG